jgi:hypothetical protein
MSSDFFKVKKGITISPIDPSELVNPEAGDLIVDSTDNNKLKAYNSDASAFEEIKGSGGGINYLSNSDLDAGIQDWTGDTNLVISHETVAPLRGTGSLKIAKAAVDASTEQVYIDFTIDPADLAKKMIISFDYDASDANYSDADMRVLIIQDPSGTPVTIRPNGEDLMGGKGTHIAQFQTDATITDYRLVIEQVSTQALAADIVIDNIQVGPREVVKGAAMTDWEDFTPSGTPSNGTLTVSKYKRIGDTGHFNLKWNTTAGFGSVNSDDIILPGHSMDVSKLVATQTGERGRYPVGKWHFADLGSNAYTGIIEYREDSDSFTMRSDVGDTIPSPGSDTVTFEVSLPIQGWSSNAKMSEDFGGREIVATGYGNDGSLIASDATDINFTEVEDTTASFDGTVFTAPESGTYILSGAVRTTATITSILKAFVDGSFNTTLGVGSSVSVTPFSGSVTLEKGQELTVRSSATSTLSNSNLHSIHIQKLASPQTILENETVAAHYQTNDTSQTTSTSITTIVYEDSIKDTHNAYNTSTGIYNVPASGWYNIDASLLSGTLSYVSGGYILIRIIVDGSTQIKEGFTRVPATGSTSYQANVSISGVYLTKGQTVEIGAATSVSGSINGAARYNVFSIARIK